MPMGQGQVCSTLQELRTALGRSAPVIVTPSEASQEWIEILTAHEYVADHGPGSDAWQERTGDSSLRRWIRKLKL